MARYPISRALRLVAVAVAVLAFSTTTFPLQVARQAEERDIDGVLDNLLQLIGKVASAKCPNSLLLSKATSFADTDFSKIVNNIGFSDPDNPLVGSASKLLQIASYEDVYVDGNKCMGDGEIVLAAPRTLQIIQKFIPNLGSLGLGIAANLSPLVNITKEHGVAVGFDQSPGFCSNDSSVKLPAGLAWVDDLDGAAPAIAKNAGVKDAKKGDLYLIAGGKLKNLDGVLRGEEPLCIFKAASNVPSSNSAAPAPPPSPSPLSKKDETGSACFPARAQVRLESGRVVRMDQVSIGDRVQVGPGQYSSVFMFTHKLPSLIHPFMTLATASGARLSLSKGHYLYANGALIPASQVYVGASVTLGSGAVDRVTATSTENIEGLYNPQTVSGDVVVDGVITSTYTTAIHPAVAHGLLAPFRFMQGMGWRCTAFESGPGALPIGTLGSSHDTTL